VQGKKIVLKFNLAKAEESTVPEASLPPESKSMPSSRALP